MPAVKEFVRNQVAVLLPELAIDPAVTAGDPGPGRSALAGAAARAGPGCRGTAVDPRQAAAYLAYLNEHPDEAQALIRSQGDVYIEYLNAHPTQVQTLLQGQSLSLASQVRDEIRERTVTADSLVDTVVRNILRLKPREALAPPPPEVQRRGVGAPA